MAKTILITGAAGFIGSHMVEHLLRKTNWSIVILDKLTYASKGTSRLKDNQSLDSRRVRIFTIDLAVPISEGVAAEIGPVDYILHMAAETHVDNSIKEPVECVLNNIASTLYILEYARGLKSLEKFFYFSTDEVYGAAPQGVEYRENDRHNPSNPYSASKSASESICTAYSNTYKIPLNILHVMNVFGERQHVEKFVPKCIDFILKGKELEIHTDEKGVPGSRFYIHARNVASAVLFLFEKSIIGETYNICGDIEIDNLTMAERIADILGLPLQYKLDDKIQERPGHDIRYALNDEKIRKMGWKSPVDFDTSLVKMVKWTLENKRWLEV